MKNILLIVLTGVLLYSCNTIKVLSDVNPTIDFTNYKTLEFFGWTDNSTSIFGSFSKNRIEKAFQTEFLKRGIVAVNKGEGDMIISLYIVSEKNTETVANTNTSYIRSAPLPYGRYGYGGYYGYGPRYGWGPTYIHSSTVYTERVYNLGTLIVSAYDAKKEELIWEAVGTKNIDRNSKTMEEDIKKAVAKIMSTYPIQPAK
ncbi:MAG TPA: DUF4136 domain-containing protein [Draconibacterium sp.]|nr:DUF4136 domain-containing protein [Draconibacterium sp.]